MNCDVAREYCGAVADREVDLVPADILDHIEACPDCSAEVGWQREAQLAVESALAGSAGAGNGARWRNLRGRLGRGRRWAAAAAVLGVMTVGTLGALYMIPRGPSADTAMLDSVHSYANPATIQSSDSSAIDGWSVGEGMPVHVVTIKDQKLIGARVSRVMNHNVVTCIYASAAGTVEVSIVPTPTAAQWPTMEVTSVENRPVGLLRHNHDSLIIVASTDPELRATMASLEERA